jgi:tetratricopeptide (TPR) repeat protein
LEYAAFYGTCATPANQLIVKLLAISASVSPGSLRGQREQTIAPSWILTDAATAGEVMAALRSREMKDDKTTLSSSLSRAISAYKSGQLVEAEQLCQQIVAAHQDIFDAIHLLALVQSLLGKKETAVASFDRALTLRPDHAEALSNRGLTLYEMRRFEVALTSFSRALNVRPDYAEALSNRGLTLHQLRRFDEALSCYDRALRVRADYAEALSNRGQL